MVGRSIATLLVSAGTAACGLLMIAGVSPATASLPGEPVPGVGPSQPPPTTESSETVPSTTQPAPSTTEPVPSTTEPAPSTTEPAPTPVPLAVSASQSIVGAGGQVTFEGRCATAPLGAVIVWIVGSSTEIIDTGVTATEWTFRWTAPTDESDFGSFTFQFWCGDPAGFDGRYPIDLIRRVDMVAVAVPTTTLPLIESAPPFLPETD